METVEQEDVMKAFEIENILSIHAYEGMGSKIIINNIFAQAEIYLKGAHLSHFQPHNQEKVIFDGKESYFLPHKNAHFGIPICWPWFGPHPTDKHKPQHGFARNMLWKVKETSTLPQGETKVVLFLKEDENTLALFPHNFTLEVTYIIGKQLHTEITTHNTSRDPMTITQALHNYLYVSDITQTHINGLEKTTYIDQLDNNKTKQQQTKLDFNKTIDRIYILHSTNCIICDPLLNRNIVLKKKQSNSTTIWNPWEKSEIHDLPHEQYKHFICVETCNTKEDKKTIQPNEYFSLKQIISIEDF